MDSRIREIDLLLDEYTGNKKIPGINLCVRLSDNYLFKKSYGYRQWYPSVEENDVETIYDMASLTKIVATWPCITRLLHEKIIHLSTEIGELWENVKNEKVKKITVFQLLTHTSGLSEETNLRQYGKNRVEIAEGILKDGIKYYDNKIHYSNKGFFLLGEIIQKLTGQTISIYSKKNIWEPLNMKNTFYGPISDDRLRFVAPTECIEESFFCKKGVVHDENAELLGGVSGHAGVFSCLNDMQIFCEELISDNPKILDKSWIIESMTPQINSADEMRGLGWRISNYRDDDLISNHYGFTGTSIWINRRKKEYVIALSNRIHPSRDNPNMLPLREKIVSIFF